MIILNSGMETNLTFFICNFNTTSITNQCIDNILRYVKSVTYKIYVLDNSTKSKFKLDDNKKNLQYITVFDNTQQQLVNFDEVMVHIKNKNEAGLKGNGKLNNYGSLKHTRSIQWFLDTCDTKYGCLMDSDAMLKCDIDCIEDGFITIADTEYYKKINRGEQVFEKMRWKTRFAPYFQIINIDMLRNSGIRYFDLTRILGGTSEIAYTYDTGSSFYQDVVRVYNLPFKHISYLQYVDHLRACSWVQNKYAKDLKIALICIAKDEDHYINEWIDYHLKLGVDDIYVYQNDWNYTIKNDQVKCIQWNTPSESKRSIQWQIDAYNDFILKHNTEYDFGIFIDVDEFIEIVHDKNIKDFLNRYIYCDAIALNQRLFGDSGHKKVINNNYSVLNRFKKCEFLLTCYIKTIINFRKSYGNLVFVSPYSVKPNIKGDHRYTAAIYDKDKRVRTDIDEDNLRHQALNIAYIKHYKAKTFEEYKIRCLKNHSGLMSGNKTMEDFNDINKNEVSID